MKKIFAVMLSAVLIMSLAGCALKSPTETTKEETTQTEVKEEVKEEVNEEAPAEVVEEVKEEPAEPEITLVYAEVNPLDTIVGKTDVAFKEKVEELSGGKIKIDIQASGVLGSEGDVLDSILGGGGTVDMSRISAFALTSYGGEKSKLLSIPYTFVSREHFWKFATSDLAPEFLLEPFENGTGIRGLFYGEEGFRHFFTSKEIKSMEDLKGMKIRVSNDPIMNGMVEALGGAPTVVAFGELYSALQTGVVDAAEQPIANYKANAFPEVAPFMILDGHTLGAIQVVIADSSWAKLTTEQQDILVEAGKYASEFNRKISQEAENEVLAELKASGVTIIEVADITPWQDACKDVIATASANNKELYQQILDMK